MRATWACKIHGWVSGNLFYYCTTSSSDPGPHILSSKVVSGSIYGTLRWFGSKNFWCLLCWCKCILLIITGTGRILQCTIYRKFWDVWAVQSSYQLQVGSHSEIVCYEIPRLPSQLITFALITIWEFLALRFRDIESNSESAEPRPHHIVLMRFRPNSLRRVSSVQCPPCIGPCPDLVW